MAKYDPLRDYLKAEGTKTVLLTFSEIESIIDDKLPESVWSHRQWWENQIDSSRRSQARAWMMAGYGVETVDQKGGSVTFVRTDSNPPT